MLNDSLGNLGQSFVINRQMTLQAKDREEDREFRRRMLEDQLAQRREAADASATARKDALEARNQVMVTWKSGGREMRGPFDKFHEIAQQYPADPDEDGFKITMHGTDENGLTTSIPVTIPTNLEKTPENQKRIAEKLKAYRDLIGAKAKPKGEFQTAATHNAATLTKLQQDLAAAKAGSDPKAVSAAQQALDNFDRLVAPKPGKADVEESEFETVTTKSTGPDGEEITKSARRKVKPEAIGFGGLGNKGYERPSTTAATTAPTALGAVNANQSGTAAGAPRVPTAGAAAARRVNPQEALDEANKAIARGADPEKVKARLRELGVMVK